MKAAIIVEKKMLSAMTLPSYIARIPEECILLFGGQQEENVQHSA